MESGDGSRAFSITGPYGSGKSSLAVFLDALCSGSSSPTYKAAVRLLREHDPETADGLKAARAAAHAGRDGFVRGIVTTPQREAIATTVLRALRTAAEYLAQKPLTEEVEAALDRALDPRLATPSYHEIRELIRKITSIRPLLLVIDEFGKNLEAYGASGSDTDIYLLQELAEWASDRSNHSTLIVVTIQHLAFEAYAASASLAQRREWAKVQGRFEDIPYVDSASATRSLIASALNQGDDENFDEARILAAARAAADAASVGLPEVASETLLGHCWPLHPVVLLALPELCARYGQNERTLFSFLASAEPLSVKTWLSHVDSIEDLPWVRVDQIYDYFVESAGNFLATSAESGRWTEVSTAIRDASGLTDAQMRVLKTVGTLNLVSATGMLRASEELVGFASADGQAGTENVVAVATRLAELSSMSLITHRDYAHEYRIWRGSDFDINRALEGARRSVAGRSLASLLADVRPMKPVVAARHSTKTGTIRAFECTYGDFETHRIAAPSPRSVCDAVLVYRLEPADLQVDGDQRVPVVVIDPVDLGATIAASVELGALLEVAEDVRLARDDAAAKRELAERIAYARISLDHAISVAFDVTASWTWLNPAEGPKVPLIDGVSTSRLSEVLDQAYSAGPSTVSYEAINRSELTSTGARARRLVIEGLVDVSRHSTPQFGMVGDGPEAAMYRAVILDSGIHDMNRGQIQAPSVSDWRRVWDETLAELTNLESAVTAEHLLTIMMSPPFGLREGTASLLLTAMLVVEAPNLAIYEHGTFVSRITAPVIERLVRNPRNYSVKSIGITRRGVRWQFIRALHRVLDERGMGEPPSQVTLLSAVQRIAALYRGAHSRYVEKTRTFAASAQDADSVRRDAVAVRDVVVNAREPDVLLFDALPAAFGLPPLEAGNSQLPQSVIDELVGRFIDALVVITSANDTLSRRVFDCAAAAVVPLASNGQKVSDKAELRSMESIAESLAMIDAVPQSVRSFIQACLMNPSNPVELGLQIATSVTGYSPLDWDDNAVHRYLAEIEETARAFRRIADLARAKASYAMGDQSFSAFAVTLTSADGVTTDRTVTLSSEQQRSVSVVVHNAIEALSELAGDPVQLLLAGIAARELGSDQASESKAPKQEKGKAYG
ncbi:hypothetical protein [Antrihabitans sp. YC2-6]|uniref:hypothetical protein n=1 Tax=Antrihabitans sp. YC2-6 TaxID=2799498 RepID=UPI0018F35AD7|nr:hypothetical protein [Antrihabitans sp. YC2-6]MBJ8348845.1 hypothetical protein [Antrihabitans sp. YC2-6]